jgi:hypothetical protein
MGKPTAKSRSHRTVERRQCPPFFSARIISGETVEEKAIVEDLSLRGLCARTSCAFEKDSIAEIELKSTYTVPVRMRARVRWIQPAEGEESLHTVGFSIHRVRIFDWFKFMKIVSQIKKEVW